LKGEGGPLPSALNKEVALKNYFYQQIPEKD